VQPWITGDDTTTLMHLRQAYGPKTLIWNAVDTKGYYDGGDHLILMPNITMWQVGPKVDK